MGKFDKSVMIALLPTTTYWARQDLPHLTLAYVGEIPDLPPTLHDELLRNTLMLANQTPPMTIDIVDTDTFGDTDKVDVFVMDQTDELMLLQRAVSMWATGQYSFTPHVTVGPEGFMPKVIPNKLNFSRIAVSWGKDLTSYKLQGS